MDQLSNKEVVLDSRTKDNSGVSSARHKEPLLVVQRSANGGLKSYIREFEKKSYQLRRIEYKDTNQQAIFEINNDIPDKEISDFINKMVQSATVLTSPKIDIFYIQVGSKEQLIKRRAVMSYESNSSYMANYSPIKTIKKYFKYDRSSKLFYLNDHSVIQIDETLRLPPKHSLRLGKGSKVIFDDNAGIIVNGSFFAFGEENARILIKGSSNLWSGVHINGGGDESLIKYLTVIGGTGLFEGIQIRGSFTINDAFISVENSKFMHNSSEDALNLNQVNGILRGVEISSTKSDGLDADFSDVTLINSRFVNIGSQTGADAIDISRTILSAKDIEITNATDKAISIGEASEAYLDELVISDSVVGIVAKDSSNVKVKNITLSNIKLADYMAYNKKSHYSGASIEVLNHLQNEPVAISEHGSAITIESRLTPTQKLDVEELYSSIMKSIK